MGTGRGPGRAAHAGWEIDLTDLELAGQIQKQFLPKSFHRVGPYEIAAAVLPAGPVCGDVFNLGRYERRWLGLWLVDATGHGVAAAMLNAFLQTRLTQVGWDSTRQMPRRPDKALALLNRLVLTHQPSEPMFVAAVCCQIDLEGDGILLARGGAPMPVVVGRGGQVRQVASRGRLVGIVKGNGFETIHLGLLPGEALLLWTDGLARLAGDECQAEDERILRATVDLEAIRLGRLADALGQLRYRWLHSRQAGECDDDVSVVIVRRWC